MAVPYTPIGGSLPWQAGAGGGGMYSGGLAGLAGAYNSAYQGSLAMNQANYGNIMAGYQQTGAQQTQALGGVAKGYGNLSQQVLGDIKGTNEANINAINQSYAQQQGQATQGLTNAGLGNTTVASSVARGLGYSQANAITNSQDQFAQLQAGYRSQLGQAALGFRGNAALQNSQLAQNQLGWMNSVNAGYPDASAYGNLAGMYGQYDQANKDRAALRGAYGGGGGGVSGGPSGGPTGGPGPSDYAGMYGASGGGAQGMPSSGQSLPQTARVAPVEFFNPNKGSIDGTASGMPLYGQLGNVFNAYGQANQQAQSMQNGEGPGGGGGPGAWYGGFDAYNQGGAGGDF